MTGRSEFCNRSRILLVPILACGGILSTAFAQETVLTPGAESRFLPWEKGSVKVGGFVSTFNSTLTFGANNGSSASLSAEDRLGLDSSLTVIRAEAMYRPGSSLRHQIDFSWGGYDRDGQATLSEEVTIGDSTYPVGAEINTVFNFDVFRLSYSYAFVQNERLRLALGLGAYVLPLEYGLDIRTAADRTVVEGGDSTLPLPALSFRGEFQIIPKLFLNLAVDGMYVEVDDFTGGLLDATVALEYRPWKHVGFGVGYSGLLAEVESDPDSDYPGADFFGEVRVDYNGLLLYGKFSF